MSVPHPHRHAAAQIEQAAQHIGLLMGEMRDAIATEGNPCEPPWPSLAERMEELSSDFASFQGMLLRHTTVLRSLL